MLMATWTSGYWRARPVSLVQLMVRALNLTRDLTRGSRALLYMFDGISVFAGIVKTSA